MRQNLVFALTGWVAGILSTLAVGLLVLPNTIGSPRVFDTPELLGLALVLVVVSPVALAGGLIGGHLPKEGGTADQIVMAVLLGVVLAAPMSCVSFYYTGW